MIKRRYQLAAGTFTNPGGASGNIQLGLFRLFGDGNGDGVVDALDLGIFRTTYNLNFTDADFLAYMDSDNSGFVDAPDLRQFALRYSLSVF